MSIKTPTTSPTNESFDDAINIREFFMALWEGKSVIVFITSLAAVCSVIFALALPNIYESKALLAPRDQNGAGGLAGFAQQYGGLASLAGISLGGGSGEIPKSMVAQQKIRSLDFFTRHLYEKIVVDLMAVDRWDSDTGSLIYNPELFNPKEQQWAQVEGSDLHSKKPSAQKAHKAFLRALTLKEDKKTSFVTIAIRHQSPVIAQLWVELIIEAVTNELRNSDVEEARGSIAFLEKQLLETSVVSLDEMFAQLIEEQTKTIMLANVSKDYVFNIIDPAVVPELKTEPKRAQICILGTIFGGMLAVLIVLIRHYAFVKTVDLGHGREK